MVDRLRALLEEPLDPSAARAVVVLASAILLGFAGLFVLAAGEDDEGSPRSVVSRAASPSPTSLPPAAVEPTPAEAHPPLHGQDPQDREGSHAARRAERALRSHRALQHVPYRSGQVAVVLVGARGDRAVLRVSAPTLGAARLGWRSFLSRYRDSGRAYLPTFRATGSSRPRGWS
jgi:hypothetical protein